MSTEKRWQMRVEHMLEAIRRVEEYVTNLLERAFGTDRRTIDAVIRNIEIIGEAARHIPVEVQSRYSQVPWSQMQGMRHVLIHNYFGVRTDIVWRTVQADLPVLVQPLERILKENP